jgi:cell wall assembly regulator SMI1/ankyrin repeat protein
MSGWCGNRHRADRAGPRLPVAETSRPAGRGEPIHRNPGMPRSPKPKSNAWKSEYSRAVARGDAAAIRRAVELGLPLNKPVMEVLLDRASPLHHAVYAGANTVVVAALIDAGADVNARSLKGGLFETPLMIAAHHGRLGLADLLLAAGADLHAKSTHGSSALSNAAGGGETEAYERLVARLLAAGAKPDAEALVAAARRGSPQVVRMLVEAGADANEVSRWGTALHLAVSGKRTDTAEALLAAGADPTLRLSEDRKTYAGTTPVELARAMKLKKLVTMLETAAGGLRPAPSPKAAVVAPPDVPGAWKRLKKALASTNPAIKASLRKGATAPRLDEFSAALGVRLPDDVRGSYLLHDGQKAEADGLFPEGFSDLDSEYILLSLSGLRAEWSTWEQLTRKGELALATANPDDGVRADWWNPGWIPVATNGGGDSLCIDLAPVGDGAIGQVIMIRHDSPGRPRLASSFGELLDRLASHYERQVDDE